MNRSALLGRAEAEAALFFSFYNDAAPGLIFFCPYSSELPYSIHDCGSCSSVPENFSSVKRLQWARLETSFPHFFEN